MRDVAVGRVGCRIWALVVVVVVVVVADGSCYFPLRGSKDGEWKMAGWKRSRAKC